MATIICNGCFDLLHDGHKQFLTAARWLGEQSDPVSPGLSSLCVPHHLIVAINSDASARKLKADRWGPGYPKDDQYTRAMHLRSYADEVFIFDSEDQLEALIAAHMPCVICKGPDYAGKRVTGDEIAPVIILDCPEPESAKALKLRAYGLEGSVCT